MVASDSLITATAPAGSGSVLVTVTAPGGAGSPVTFTYPAAQPAVTSISPSQGQWSSGTPTTVTITGSGFTGATAVYFGFVPATGFTVVSDTQITATLPNGTGSASVTVTTPAGNSPANSAMFAYLTAQSVPVDAGGGQVSTPDDDGALVIPAGALASVQTVGLTELAASQLQDPVPSGDVLVGTAINVNLGFGVTLSTPGTLTLNYDSSLVPSGYTTAIYQDGAWAALTTTLDDPQATVSITGSGDYAVLAVPAFSSGGGSPAPSGGSGGNSLAVNNTGSAMITPSVGGTVWLGSEAAVTIPMGALAGDTPVAVTVQQDTSSPASPDGFMLLGSVYQFTVGGQDHYAFNSPVTLTFTLDPSSIPSGQTPAVYYYDETSKQWVGIGGTVNNDTITVTVDHFTDYAVFTTKTAQTTTPTFSDVPTSYWGYAAISSLSGKGIVSGYPNGTFKPGATITRAEFATMLVKTLSLNPAGATSQFTDVTAGDWYCNSVNTAVYAGLVSGMGDHLFAPNAAITREQMAVMVAHALGDNAPAVDRTELNDFSDRSAVGSWAVSGLEEAVRAGIVSGMTAGTLAPLDNTTSAQAAAMIYKLLTVLGK